MGPLAVYEVGVYELSKALCCAKQRQYGEAKWASV